MIRLKLPRRLEEPPAGLPPALRWDAPRESAAILLGRRQFLKALALLLAAVAAPLTRARQAVAAARGRFLTAHELATLGALCDQILPPDQDAGAKALGAARYIDRMLAAFDRRRVPLVYAGGPFSGRTPFADNDTGQPSRRRPRNDFKRFVPLSRVQELRWRAELFGSARVEGAAFNDAALGPLVGLRTIYREGLRKVDQVSRTMAGRPFVQLSRRKREEIFVVLPGAFAPDRRRDRLRFTDLLLEHTLEGCFAPPEYGGNRRTRGWRLIGLEGDAHPLGYSIFSRAVNGYLEREGHPVSTPNPDELVNGVLTPRPLGPDGERIQRSIITLARLPGLDC